MAKNVSVDGGNDWGGLGREDGGNVALGKGEAHGASKGSRVPRSGRSGSFGPGRQNGDGQTPVTGEDHRPVPVTDQSGNGRGRSNRQKACVLESEKHDSKKSSRGGSISE